MFFWKNQKKMKNDAASRIRTCVGTKPAALEAAPFVHSGIAAHKKKTLGSFLNLL